MFRLVLKKLREEKGISQYKLADELNVAQSTIGMWESGKREPDIKMIKKVATFFNVSIDVLLGENDNTKKEITFDDFTFAMHRETKKLSNESKNALLNMAKALNNEIEREENKSR